MTFELFQRRRLGGTVSVAAGEPDIGAVAGRNAV